MDHAELAQTCAIIARKAGEAIMAIYARDFTVSHKHDDSPLTAADLAAHHRIVAGLRELTPLLPVLSEESAEQAAWSERRDWPRYWLVDPLDGTREFIKRNGEFTVNIALIENHAPTLGVVYAPALDEMYLAWQNGGAWAEMPQSGKVKISSRLRATPLVVAGSRSHADPRLSGALDKLGAHELVALGSSLKFCRTAQGQADLYARYGPTSEWDTAAGQCVLEQAGGGVTRLDGTRLTYNTKASLLNPDFLAFGDKSVDWAGTLREPTAA
ncbi:MAG: 3'(2'),5'-bisphosphate nucleotidase CysQ [Proteobacteria bacterium]|nr:3'(2'),5'-bisphosphate nucleotidase CysQ [Pseudomonadota bacterium]